MRRASLPTGSPLCTALHGTASQCSFSTTVGDSLLTQPLTLNDANLLAVSPGNELAVVLHGTHNGQLETVDGMLARAPLAGGSPKELLADVRWADWDAAASLAVVHDVDGHSRLEYPDRQGALPEQQRLGSATFVSLPMATRSHSWIIPALWDNRGRGLRR